jgi:hypothetical protein
MGTNLLIVGTVSPFSLLQNPMILIAGLSMLVVFGMPYLMDNSTFALLQCLLRMLTTCSGS